MAFFGGDLKEITVSTPTLGTITLKPKAAEDFTYDLGGLRNTEIAMTGSAQAIYKKNMMPWKVSGPIAWDMITALELQSLCQVAANNEEADFTFTNVNGSVYGAKGTIGGDLEGNVNNSTVPTTFSGGGSLTKIA